MTCNPGADGKRELKELNNKEASTAYVGETSRSVKERTQEHWGAYRSRNKDSHMLKHQELQHGGAAPPKFVMRIVSGARSALERQTKEAVRIRRRGGEGAILNSKAEFNRCYISRLQLGELDVEQLEREEKEELQSISRELDENLEDWEQRKAEVREHQRKSIGKSLGRSQRSIPTKQKKEQGAEKTSNKRRKYELVKEGWGHQAEVKSLNQRREQPTAPPLPITQPPVPSSPSQNSNHSSPTAPQIAVSPRYPDDSSLVVESFAQGLPPVQVAPSVEHLYVGHLGEVTFRGGVVTSPTLPPTPNPPQPPNQVLL